jgi:hypothetical protein
MLTARVEDTDKIHGLDLGADDGDGIAADWTTHDAPNLLKILIRLVSAEFNPCLFML